MFFIKSFGDLNGDGRDDQVCVWNMNNGKVAYRKNEYAPKKNERDIFSGTVFTQNFCSVKTGADFHLADLNGDGKKDFVCLKTNGSLQIAISKCT